MSTNPKPPLYPMVTFPGSAIIRLIIKLDQSNWLLRFVGRQANAPKNMQKTFVDYTPTTADVFVASYAKSGTYWMMQIAQQVAYRGEAEFDYIHDLVPWPESPLPIVPAQLKDESLAARSPTGLRIIKTHHSREYTPFVPEAKYIVVVRDPKEVFVSSYFFGKEVLGTTLGIDYTLAEWFKLFPTADFLFGSWAKHTASWWSVRDRANVLLLTYQDLKRQPRQGIQQVADLMGVTLSESQLDKIAEKSSFAYMKAHEAKFSPKIPSGRNVHIQPLLVRKGKSGQSDELITREQQAFIDRFCQAELKRLGSDFPYTTLFETVTEPA